MDEFDKKQIDSNRKIFFEMTVNGLEHRIGTENINSLSIIHDYISTRSPMYILRLFIPRKVYMMLYEMISPFKPIIEGIDLRMLKHQDDSDSEDTMTTLRSYHNMSAIIDRVDDYDFTDKKNMDAVPNDVSEDKDMILTLNLFSKVDISAASKGYSNNIIPEGNMNQALYDVLSNCVNDNVKLWIEPSANTKSYKNIVLPPVGILESLDYLQEEYGIYKYPPNTYCRDGVYYVLPITGKIDNTGQDKPYNHTYFIDVRNSLTMNSDDYLNEVTDSAISVIAGKDKIGRNKIYNAKHTIHGYLDRDGGARIPDKDPNLIYDRYIINSKNGSVSDVANDIKMKVISVPLNCVPVEYDVYPNTMFKIINERFEGWYRVAKYMEVFTSKDYIKTVEIHNVD